MSRQLQIIIASILLTSLSAGAATPLADGFDYPIGASPPGRVTPENDTVDSWQRDQAFKATNAEITAVAIEQGATIPDGRLLQHAGEDWGGNSAERTDAGRLVYAVATGEVRGIRELTAESSSDSIGSVIVIQHSLPGVDEPVIVSSLYLHVTPVAGLSSGDLVERGEPIAVIADITAIEPHLHFELRDGAVDVDALWPNDTFSGYYLEDAQLMADGFSQPPSSFLDNNRTIAVPAAPRLYIHDNDGVLGRVRVSDGLVDVIGLMDVVMTDIAFSPEGVLYGLSFDALFRIDLVTADVELIGDHGIAGGNALVFASDGTLLAGGGFTDGLFELNLATGAGTQIANMGHNSAGDLVFFEGNLYLSSTSNQLVLIDLDAIGGGEEIGTAVGDIGFSSVFGLATASNGKMYGSAGTELFEVDVSTGAGSMPGVGFAGQGMRATNGSSFFLESGGVNAPVFTSVLPNSRSVQTGQVASVFLSAIVGGDRDGIGCEPSLAPGFVGTFDFQATDPATNQLTGIQNESVDIPAGTARSFVLLVVPTDEIDSDSVEVLFGCENTEIAEISRGINTLLLSASDEAPVDIVALAATVSNDGIVTVDPAVGGGAFAVAAINIGVGEAMTITLDTGTANPLPLQYSVCETDPLTSICLEGPATSVTTQIDQNATPTFGVFISGESFTFSPGVNRIFVRFRDSNDVVRGSTSVALRFGG